MFSLEPMKLLKFLRTPFSTEHLWWLLLKSKILLWLAFCLKHVALQIIQISFPSNGNWKKKDLLMKCIICKTEIRRIKIRLKASLLLSCKNTSFISPHDDVYIFLHTYVCSFYFLATLLQTEWHQNMFFFFFLNERDTLN